MQMKNLSIGTRFYADSKKFICIPQMGLDFGDYDMTVNAAFLEKRVKHLPPHIISIFIHPDTEVIVIET